ncbi:MAG TPA: hypothetical protein VEZ13_04500 [Brevibacillus sp.]|nr:hypothetical protein [Brevibacillus sp.]
MSIAAVGGRIRFPVFAPFFVRKDDLSVRSATIGGESQKQLTLRSKRRVAILFPANRRSAGWVEYRGCRGENQVSRLAPFFVRKDDWTVRSATFGGESQKQPTLRSNTRLRFFFPPIVAPLGGTTQWAATGNLILPRSL